MLKTLIAKLKRFADPMPALSYKRDAIEAWSLSMGREAAELWLEAIAARDARTA
ncbi:MAG: hypothetical protein WDN08_11465 [Rhizomicrobium sp.]